MKMKIIKRFYLIKSLKPLPSHYLNVFNKEMICAAAYELSKKEISKWKDSVQALRQAEVLKFPMINQEQDTIRDSALTFRSDNVPTTELEKESIMC